MGIGVSIFFITLGAILRFAIAPDVLGDQVHIDVIGVIFMTVGGAGLLISLILSFRRSGRTTEPRAFDHDNNPPQV